MSIVLCSTCSSEGKENRCYITGYSKKCGHDCGWAYSKNQNGIGEILNCSRCFNNKLYITGYDIKCGHDNGWAFSGIEKSNASCKSCQKVLKGYWSIESNASNNKLCHNGKFLGISDGYFLQSDKSDWVNCYCYDCWIQKIKQSLPKLGINVQGNDSLEEINLLNVKIVSMKEKIVSLENEKINLLKDFENLRLKNEEIEQMNQQIINENSILISKLSDKENVVLNLIDKYENLKKKFKNIEEISKIFGEIKHNEEVINLFDLIIKEEDIDEMRKLSDSEDIKELSCLFDSSKSKFYTNTLQEEILSILNKTREKFFCEIKIKIEVINESYEKKISQYEENIKRIKKNMMEMEMPDEIISESNKPLEKYLDDLKRKTEILKKIKEKL